jgi:hypothetical protein
MSKFLLALLAASLSPFGSLVLHVYSSRENRRNIYNEKRLDALLAVRREVESACGNWYGWADSVLKTKPKPDPKSVRDKKREEAETATDRAWYSIRRYEMYFPTLKDCGPDMRKQLEGYRSAAEDMVKAGGVFDGNKFESKSLNGVLDSVVERSRELLGYPKR